MVTIELVSIVTEPQCVRAYHIMSVQCLTNLASCRNWQQYKDSVQFHLYSL